jgi:predicted amidophosphoribosyltransferase
LSGPAYRGPEREYNLAAFRSTEAATLTLGKKTVSELARAAARFVLPSVCLACRSNATDRFWRGGVCEACWARVPEPAPRRCRTCDEAIPAAPLGAACGRCLLEPPAFEQLRAAAPYSGPARPILLAFKFQGADYLGARLAELMILRLGTAAAAEVACVPSTARALRERGYHPASVLAAAVAKRLSLPCAPGRLRKVRETERQSRVAASARAANVRRAFAVHGAPAGPVLLVDDVATSGATARECAARLIAAGAPSVTVWCFARASRADLVREAA